MLLNFTLNVIINTIK